MINLENNSIIEIPFVFTREQDGYHGFVPGLNFRDIVDKDINACRFLLQERVVHELEKFKINKYQNLPFFPLDEYIYRDFENVVKIERINFKK